MRTDMLRLTTLVTIVLALSTSGRAADTARPALTGIDHVVFKTSSNQAAQRFYGDLLGLNGVVGGGVAGATDPPPPASPPTWSEDTGNNPQRIFLFTRRSP